MLIVIYSLTGLRSYLHTFFVVTFVTGTNFPAVRWNPLLAVAITNIKHRWNGIGVPIQSHPNATSLILSAWNISQLMYLVHLIYAAVRLMYKLPVNSVLMSDSDNLKIISMAGISWLNFNS